MYSVQLHLGYMFLHIENGTALHDWKVEFFSHLNRWGNWKQWLTLFFWAPKSLQIVIAAMKLKDSPWKESYDQPRQHIKKHRHYFVNKGPSSQGYSFSSGHVWT